MNRPSTELLTGLLCVGFALTVIGLRGGEPVQPVVWRPVVAVLAAVLVFAFVERLGLLLSTVALVAVATLAQSDWQFRRMLSLAVGLTGFAVVAFVILLRMPIPLWPRLSGG